MTARLFIAITTLMLASAWAPAAEAQSANDAAEIERARLLFEEAMMLVEAGRTAEGRDAFRQSLQMHPAVVTALNLAIALRQTGQVLESTQLLRRVVVGELGELDDDRRQRVNDELALSEAELAHVSVNLVGVETAAFSIDGEPRGDIGPDRPTSFPIDPGTHVLAAASEDGQSSTQRVRLDRAQRRQVEFRFAPPSVAVPEAPHDEESSSAIYWWLGAGAVVAAVGTVLVVLLLTAEPDPTGDVIFTLRPP